MGAAPPLPVGLECWDGAAWRTPLNVFARTTHTIVLTYPAPIAVGAPYRISAEIATRWFRPEAQVKFGRTGSITGPLVGPPP